jgi:hypothetical protein
LLGIMAALTPSLIFLAYCLHARSGIEEEFD